MASPGLEVRQDMASRTLSVSRDDRFSDLLMLFETRACSAMVTRSDLHGYAQDLVAKLRHCPDDFLIPQELTEKQVKLAV